MSNGLIILIIVVAVLLILGYVTAVYCYLYEKTK